MTDGYAVIDVETTGLFPNGSDRVIEIAVIRLDQQGELIGEYETLLNPQRDMGATHIHGIRAGDVASAPRFEAVAGDILALIHGATLVAHNASFDRRFLYAETMRTGIDLPEIPTVCTMQLARKADLNIPGRKLAVLCEYFGIPLLDAHCARSDAHATASLFKTCVDRLGGWTDLDLSGVEMKPAGARATAWPSVTPAGYSYCRTHAAADTQDVNRMSKGS